MTQKLRSVLLCTPLNPRHIQKSLMSGADLVVFDLEDSVEVSRKPEARSAVAAALASKPGPTCYVRLNGMTSAHFEEDLAALVRLQRVAGFVLPKVEVKAELPSLDRRLVELEGQAGRQPGSLRVIPLIETALGVENLAEILNESPRVDRVSFGAGDYTLDIGATLSPDEASLQYIRARVVNASRAFGKQPPIDSVWLDVSDEEGLRVSARRAQTLGFAGKLCIHPKQVGVVNDVFSPSAQAVETARKHLTAFTAALEAGLAAIHVDGVLVDYPIAERARRVLAAAGVSPS